MLRERDVCNVSNDTTHTNINTNTMPPIRAVAWDPTAPSSLCLCRIPRSETQRDTLLEGMESNLSVLLAHDGTGCSPAETETLIKYLDARDKWILDTKELSPCDKMISTTILSMKYRDAMRQCLMNLSDKTTLSDSMDHEDHSATNYQLLQLTYAISQLGEIFLLPLSKDSLGDLGFKDPNGVPPGRLNGPPGSLTADTIRYLRLHHTTSSTLLNSPTVQQILQSDQPEYYEFPSNVTPSHLLSGPYDYPFWNLLLQFVRLGELSQAWTVLSQHSACRHAEEKAAAAFNGEEACLTLEGEGFLALREILLTAPIPGGRGDAYCDDSGLQDLIHEDILVQEKEEWLAQVSKGHHHIGDVEDIHLQILNDLPSNSYLVWEALPRRANRLRVLRHRRDLRRCGLLEDENSDIDDMELLLPEFFQSRIAMNSFQTWQEKARAIISPRSNRIGSDDFVAAALFRRFPPLQQIMSILLGNIHPSIVSGSWSEVLITELLYMRPNIMPEDIALRANYAMTREGRKKQDLEKIILSIMNGNSGNVIQSIFVFGGSSGAALPATVASLLCNLLMDAGCIPNLKNSIPTTSDIQIEILLLAAESILSSFSVQEQSDLGVRTAVQLLLPYAPPKHAPSSLEDPEITYEPRISAFIAEMIARRYPATDAEAHNLLNLTADMVRLGSTRVADACETLAFSRASYHRCHGNRARQVYWLLRGIEVMSCWLPLDYKRKHGFSCRRHFDALCENSADELLSYLAANTQVVNEKDETIFKKTSLAFYVAKSVVDSVLQDYAISAVLKGHTEVNLLQYIVNIAVAEAKNDYSQAATNIIHCLKELCIKEGCYEGCIRTLANPSMYFKLLQIAVAILNREETNLMGRMEHATCAFSSHDIQILMARMTQVLTLEGSHHSSSTEYPFGSDKNGIVGTMRLALCKGLMRAFASGL